MGQNLPDPWHIVWRVFKPIDHECLYELKTNLLMPREEKYKIKSWLVVTFSSQSEHVTTDTDKRYKYVTANTNKSLLSQAIHTVRLRGLLYFTVTSTFVQFV